MFQDSRTPKQGGQTPAASRRRTWSGFPCTPTAESRGHRFRCVFRAPGTVAGRGRRTRDSWDPEGPSPPTTESERGPRPVASRFTEVSRPTLHVVGGGSQKHTTPHYPYHRVRIQEHDDTNPTQSKGTDDLVRWGRNPRVLLCVLRVRRPCAGGEGGLRDPVLGGQRRSKTT